MCVKRGRGCLRLSSRRKHGAPEVLCIFTAPEVVSDFGFPGVLGLQDVSRVVLDLVQCQAHHWYSVNSCLSNNDTHKLYLLGSFYEPSQVASAGLEVVFCRGRGSEWFQGALRDPFSPSSTLHCALWAGTRDLSFNIALCFPKRGSKKGSMSASG